MSLLSFGPFVWLRHSQTRVDALRALLEPAMTDLESENAQAERELASLDTDTDPEPGAFYGHDTDPDQTEQSHA